MTPKSEIIDSWLRVLHPDALRGNLTTIALYVLIYELLCDSIEKQVRDFFLLGCDERDFAYSSGYQSAVLSRDRSSMQASLLWLLEMGAIEDSDMADFDRMRIHRNEIVHELPRFIMDPGKRLDFELTSKALNLLSKVDTWFIREIEIPTNPDIDPNQVNLNDVASMRMIIVHFIVRTAVGIDNGETYRQFCETLNAAQSVTEFCTRHG